jgi:hypothetical protein
MSKLFQGSGSKQKDPDPRVLGSVSITCIRAHHTRTCNSEKKRKNQSLFRTFDYDNTRKVFRHLPNSCYDGPRKIRCYKVVAVCAKNKMANIGNSHNGSVTIWQIAAQRDMPRNKYGRHSRATHVVAKSFGS